MIYPTNKRNHPSSPHFTNSPPKDTPQTQTPSKSSKALTSTPTPKTIYQELSDHGTSRIPKMLRISDISASLTKPYTAFFVHGHSTPAGTDVNAQKNIGWFTAENLDTLQTPFFGADGCYAGGWWSNQQDNDKLDPSIDGSWYGSKIFTSTSYPSHGSRPSLPKRVFHTSQFP